MENVSGNTRVENVWTKNSAAVLVQLVVQLVVQVVVTPGVMGQMAAVQTIKIMKPEIIILEVVVHLTKTFIGTFKRC